jgi:hypothetical protein
MYFGIVPLYAEVLPCIAKETCCGTRGYILITLTRLASTTSAKHTPGGHTGKCISAFINLEAIAEFAAAPVAVVMRVCNLPGWPLLGKYVCLQSIMPHV